MTSSLQPRLGALALAALLAGPALADEGMVTLLQGRGTVAGAHGKAAIVPFMKLRRGDRIELEDGARLQILYGATGRQETWNGKAAIEVGAEASLPRSAAAPMVRKLPTAALQRLAQAPSVLTDIRNRTGMVMVRSGGLLDKIRAVEAMYEELRQAATPEDVTPELYLVSALYELKLYRDMESILQDIVARQPDNQEARQIMEHLGRVMGTREAP